jgi:hypothetical protein
MYALILILGINVNTVGTYASAQDCQAQLVQFTKQDVKAACVKQQSPDEAMKQAQVFFNGFQSMISKMDIKE